MSDIYINFFDIVHEPHVQISFLLNDKFMSKLLLKLYERLLFLENVVVKQVGWDLESHLVKWYLHGNIPKKKN